jgi:hypothetical protein
VRVPVACTLTASASSDRLEEWRQFLVTSITAAERTSDEKLRLRLVDSPAALTGAADLAQREKACCAFFEFSIELDASSRWLAVEVSPDASEMLTDFATLLPLLPS